MLLWQEYTELCKKYLNDPDNHNGVITHLEPDILECEVKRALRSITMNKARGGDGIPVELFQILKDDAVKVNKINMPAGLENSNSGHRTGKGQCSFQSQRRTMPKNVQTTAQLHSSYTVAKQCSKFSKPGLNSTCTINFQMFKLDLEKAEEPEMKLPKSIGSWKKQENARKTSTSALLIMPRALTV